MPSGSESLVVAWRWPPIVLVYEQWSKTSPVQGNATTDVLHRTSQRRQQCDTRSRQQMVYVPGTASGIGASSGGISSAAC